MLFAAAVLQHQAQRRRVGVLLTINLLLATLAGRVPVVRRIASATLGSCLAVLLATVPAPAIEGRYHGRVVDTETKQPLEGAVVTVIWMKTPFFSMDGVKDFHQAREVLTDPEGRFAVDAKPSWTLRSVPRPEIIVFKPGYGRYGDMYGKLSGLGIDAFIATQETLYARRPVTIDLPRLRMREEMLKFVDPELHPNVELEDVPIFQRLLNEYRHGLGFEPLGVPSEAPPRGKR